MAENFCSTGAFGMVASFSWVGGFGTCESGADWARKKNGWIDFGSGAEVSAGVEVALFGLCSMRGLTLEAVGSNLERGQASVPYVASIRERKKAQSQHKTSKHDVRVRK